MVSNIFKDPNVW